MIPLEDNFADIIGKAQRGLGLSDTQLAEKARVNSQTVRKLRAGEFDELTALRSPPVPGVAARARSEPAPGSWPQGDTRRHGGRQHPRAKPQTARGASPSSRGTP